MAAQDIVVYLVVLAAVAYLVRGLTQSVTGRKSCGGCGSAKKCGGSATQAASTGKPAAEQLIQIGLNSGFAASRNGHAAIGDHKRENSTTEQ